MENPMSERQFLPPLAELFDRMTITQIKLALLRNGKNDFSTELRKLEHDIDLIIQKNDIALNSKFIRSVIILAQMNLHIWYNKDKMQSNLDNEAEYLRLLKLAHQLNGIRNQVKNSLLDLEGIKDQSQKRSNFEIDGLNWNIE